MPGFDGTGPAGLGPMSGACRGYCVVKMPLSEEPETGWAGLPGWSFTYFSDGLRERFFLRLRIDALQQQIQRLNQRLSSLEFIHPSAE